MDNNGGGGSGGEIRHPMAAERSPLALAVEQSSNRFTVHDMATTGVVPGSSGNSSGSNVLGTINKTTNHQGEKWKWKKKSLGSSCRTELSQLSPPSSLLFIVANSGLLFLFFSVSVHYLFAIYRTAGIPSGCSSMRLHCRRSYCDSVHRPSASSSSQAGYVFRERVVVVVGWPGSPLAGEFDGPAE